MRQWRWITGAAVALAIAACGGSGGGSGSGITPPNNTGGNPPPSGGANTNTITLQSQSFSPSAITVPKGTTVVFAWPSCDPNAGYGGYGGDGCVSHNVVFDDGSNISSGTQSTGTFTRTFNATGTFGFHCSIHGASVMSGTVTVQ